VHDAVNTRASDSLLRAATPSDSEAVAGVWQEAWHAGHAAIVLPDVLAYRTFAHFLTRVPPLIDDMIVAENAGEILGFAVAREDLVDHLFVAAAGRGTGLAARLLRAAEKRLAAAGIREARLGSFTGNKRAHAFYSREGWTPRGIEQHDAWVPEGVEAPTYPITVFTKRLEG
jgi:GNAT superfamily N-acetyltransferase